MKNILAANTLVALRSGAAMVALSPTDATAQSMTDWNLMYSLCINNPGACNTGYPI